MLSTVRTMLFGSRSSKSSNKPKNRDRTSVLDKLRRWAIPSTSQDSIDSASPEVDSNNSSNTTKKRESARLSMHAQQTNDKSTTQRNRQKLANNSRLSTDSANDDNDCVSSRLRNREPTSDNKNQKTPKKSARRNLKQQIDFQNAATTVSKEIKPSSPSPARPATRSRLIAARKSTEKPVAQRLKQRLLSDSATTSTAAVKRQSKKQQEELSHVQDSGSDSESDTEPITRRLRSCKLDSSQMASPLDYTKNDKGASSISLTPTTTKSEKVTSKRETSTNSNGNISLQKQKKAADETKDDESIASQSDATDDEPNPTFTRQLRSRQVSVSVKASNINTDNIKNISSSMSSKNSKKQRQPLEELSNTGAVIRTLKQQRSMRNLDKTLVKEAESVEKEPNSVSSSDSDVEPIKTRLRGHASVQSLKAASPDVKKVANSPVKAVESKLASEEKPESPTPQRRKLRLRKNGVLLNKNRSPLKKNALKTRLSKASPIPCSSTDPIPVSQNDSTSSLKSLRRRLSHGKSVTFVDKPKTVKKKPKRIVYFKRIPIKWYVPGSLKVKLLDEKKDVGPRLKKSISPQRRASRQNSKKINENNEIPSLAVSSNTDETCTICEEVFEKSKPLACYRCQLIFHPYCVGYKRLGNFAKYWVCPDCVRCFKCKKYISDPDNVQCNACGTAYHGDCRPIGSAQSNPPFDRWFCALCTKFIKTERLKRKTSMPTKTRHLKNVRKTNFQQFRRRQRPPTARRGRCKTAYRFHGSIGLSLFRLILSNAPARFKKIPNFPMKEDSIDVKPNIKAESFRRMIKNLSTECLHAVEDTISDADLKDAIQFTTKLRTLPEYEHLSQSTIFVKKSDAADQPEFTPFKQESPVEKVKNSQKVPQLDAIAAKRKEMKERKIYMQQFALPRVVEKYETARRNAEPLTQFSKQFYDDIISQLVFDEKIEAYICFNLQSIYPVSENSPHGGYSPLVLCCQKCFDIFDDVIKLLIHMKICQCSHPPGNEIYRDEYSDGHGGSRTVSCFEVIGTENLTYLEHLSNVASFLLPSKADNTESYNFTFYILTQFEKEAGFLPVGYFSKELHPSENNNLSCLLVFPQYRGLGYGKLMIDISYEMSRRELKVGSPEHPLSSNGLSLYRSYWRGILTEYLREHRNDEEVLLEPLSRATHIHIKDLRDTLVAYEMVKIIDNVAILDCSKAWYCDLRVMRRLKFNPDLLFWKSPFDPAAPPHYPFYNCFCNSSDEEDT